MEKVVKMKNCLAALFCLLSLSSSFAQTDSQESQRNEFKNGLYIGCIEKQSQNQLTASADFTSDVCSCYANDTTDHVFANLDFQIAFKSKDSLAMKTAINQVITKEKTEQDFHYCLNKTQDNFTKTKKPIIDKSTKELSTKRGLLGETRESFIRGGILECVDTAKSSSPQTQAYCSCSVNSMADNVSQKDLYEIGVNSAIGQRKMKEMGELGLQRCGHFLK